MLMLDCEPASTIPQAQRSAKHRLAMKLAVGGKKVSGTFSAKHPKGRSAGKGTGHLFSARSLAIKGEDFDIAFRLHRIPTRAAERLLVGTI
jgi:hypothetical protein